MPIAAAIPLITTLGGAALSAFGGSKKQGGQNTSGVQDSNTHQDTTTTGNQHTTGHQTSASNLTDTNQQDTSGMNLAVEDPLATLFRYGQMGNIQSEITRAQNKPVYGDAEKAGFLNKLNDLGDASFKSLGSNLAKHGALNSGAFSQGASDLEMQRNGAASSFFAGLPFQEEQARQARLQPLLGLGAALAGHGPISQFTSGTLSGTRNASQTGEQNSDVNVDTNQHTVGDQTNHGTTSGQTTASGPSFGAGLFSNLGGIFGDFGASKGGLSGLFKNFLPKSTPNFAWDPNSNSEGG